VAEVPSGTLEHRRASLQSCSDSGSVAPGSGAPFPVVSRPDQKPEDPIEIEMRRLDVNPVAFVE
jgi:hypothetical protein